VSLHRATSSRARRLVAALGAVTLLAVACGDGGTGDDGPSAGPPDADGQAEDTFELSVAVASYDLAVGEDRRLLTGLFTADRQLLAFGEVTFQLAFLGDEPGGQAELTQETTATYLPVPGMEPEGDSDQPILLEDPTGNGVYAGRVDLDQPGFWGVRVIAELADGRVVEGNTAFAVGEEPLNPDVGDQAPRTVNLTLEDVEAGRVAPVAVDSRAQDPDAELTDPHLHATTVAGSLDAGRPVVVMVSTPVYCVSRFCGPLVEVVADIATEFEDRADVVHLEVWEDFEDQRLNDAAAEWILTEAGTFEPWVWLVDGDGTVLARWDNVVDVEELRTLLSELPEIEPLSALGALG
jgi:hypothetical protein